MEEKKAPVAKKPEAPKPEAPREKLKVVVRYPVSQAEYKLVLEVPDLSKKSLHQAKLDGMKHFKELTEKAIREHKVSVELKED